MFHKNPEVDDKIIEAVAAFSKQNKVSKTKVEDIVCAVLKLLPKAAGKPTSEKAFSIREAIKEQKAGIMEEFPNGWSIKELAEYLGYDAPNTSNQVRWMVENEPGLLQMIGKRPALGKGKPSTLFNYL